MRKGKRYVRERKLGGMMFWEYFGDPEQKLLQTIDQGLAIKRP